jgi:hypothetical protein
MTEPFTRTAEGFLTGRAIVTSVGVFTYRHEDGSVTRELRLPEEVFDSESLNSMRLKPVVNDHPSEMVTEENIQKYQVGNLGSNPSSTVQIRSYDGYTPREQLTDGFHVAIDMIINKADAINDVLNGKRALSMGYECEIESAEAGSVWCGMEYDHIQRKIRYNHVAIVDAARAGDAARIRMDGGAVLIPAVNKDNRDNKTEKEQGMGLKKINLDGVEYEGDEVLILKFTEQRNRADNAEKALEAARKESADKCSRLEAERDAQKDRADKAEKALKDAKEIDPERLDAAVRARVILLDAAERAGVEVKDGMSEMEIQKAVILALYPGAKLDGRDAVYLGARFDAAVEVLDRQADAVSREVLGGRSAGRADSASAYRRMVSAMKARSRGQKAEG